MTIIAFTSDFVRIIWDPEYATYYTCGARICALCSLKDGWVEDILIEELGIVHAVAIRIQVTRQVPFCGVMIFDVGTAVRFVPLLVWASSQDDQLPTTS